MIGLNETLHQLCYKGMSNYNKTVSSKIGRQQGNDIRFISFRYTYMRRRAKHDSEPTFKK